MKEVVRNQPDQGWHMNTRVLVSLTVVVGSADKLAKKPWYHHVREAQGYK